MARSYVFLHFSAYRSELITECTLTEDLVTVLTSGRFSKLKKIWECAISSKQYRSYSIAVSNALQYYKHTSWLDRNAPSAHASPSLFLSYSVDHRTRTQWKETCNFDDTVTGQFCREPVPLSFSYRFATGNSTITWPLTSSELFSP